MLTKQQQQVARALYEGTLTNEEICERFGVSRRRLQRWLSREEFLAEMQQLQQQSIQETRSILARYGPAAAWKLVELLQADKPEVVRRAALDLIDRCRPATETPPENIPDQENPDMSDEQAWNMLRILARGQS
ncbi:MAG: helix-turn-helix domain-containing protein [Sedimentisphaerales bacterium]|nr:helix-turn-helix domain-containing protein [Sedimentisphaerales bacterium]